MCKLLTNVVKDLRFVKNVSCELWWWVWCFYNVLFEALSFKVTVEASEECRFTVYYYCNINRSKNLINTNYYIY